MRAVVLAAGAGSRLRDISPVKPLTPLNGRSLLHRVLDALGAGGATAATVVTGYETDAVTAEARAHPLVDATPFNADWERAPNGVSVLAARDAFGDAPALLCMADHLLSAPVVRAAVDARPAALALAVDRRLGHAWVDEADVTRVRTAGDAMLAIGKGLLVYDCYDTGLFRATGALVDALGGLAAPSLSEGVAALARLGQAVVADIGDSAWLDVDDARAWRLAEEHWRD